LAQPKWINHWLIEQFATWRAGGPPMETRVEENLQASALVFCAIESQRRGVTVKVQDFIKATGAAIAAAWQDSEGIDNGNEKSRAFGAYRWSAWVATTSVAASISRRRAGWSTPRSMQASPCSIPPTAMATALPRKPCLAKRWATGARIF
jgi:hypothetical protein